MVLLRRVGLEVDLVAAVLLRLADAQLVPVERGAAVDAVHREALAAADLELTDLAVLCHVIQIDRAVFLGRVRELRVPAPPSSLRRQKRPGGARAILLLARRTDASHGQQGVPNTNRTGRDEPRAYARI